MQTSIPEAVVVDIKKDSAEQRAGRMLSIDNVRVFEYTTKEGDTKILNQLWMLADLL